MRLRNSMMARISSLIILVTPVAAHAASFADVIVKIQGYMNTIVSIAVGFAFIGFLYIGVELIRNAGDESGRKINKRRLFWGVIIMFVIVSIWGIVAYLATILGVTTGNTLPPPML